LGLVRAAEVAIQGDVYGDGIVDFGDFAVFAAQWLKTKCNQTDWCGGADFDRSSEVNAGDLADLARNWLAVNTDALAVQNANEYPTRLAVSPDGRYFVTDAKVGSVFIYDPNLTLAGELKGIDRPLGIAVDSQGDIYVGSNSADTVEVYRSDGVKIAGIGEGNIRMPNDLVFDRDGNLYVVDSLNNIVRVYDSARLEAGSIGGAGNGEGEFTFPVALAIVYRADANGIETGELYVADQGNYRVQVFDLDGNFLRSFGGQVTSGMMGYKWQGKFVKIQSLEIDYLGRVHACDSYTNRVQILNPDTGGYISSYGSAGSGPGELSLPLDIVITDSNDVVVANAENKRVEVIYTVP
jgi:hypothetical protein